MSTDELITPCCGTRIEPAAGFQGIDCCGQHFDREELEAAAESEEG